MVSAQVFGKDKVEALKKVLILTYYFPPLGMGGTQRAAKFAKYLPQFGWQPVVLTVKDVIYFAKDKSLLQDVSNCTVIRTGSLDPQRLLWIFGFRGTSGSPQTPARSSGWGLLNRILAWFLVPDTKLLWLPFVTARALIVGKRTNAACVLTTGPPHSVHLAGIMIKKLLKIPLVVDFRDGWSQGNFQFEPTKVHVLLNRVLEKWVLQKADRIVTVANGLTEALQQRVQVMGDRFSTISNGYDQEDFSAAVIVPSSPKKFRIVYCGALTAISPVERFLDAMADLLQKRTELREVMRLEFVGQELEGSLSQRVGALGLQDVVTVSGYCEHHEALARLRGADLLLYTVADWASSDFVPGKTFEYMASGAPVLAIGPRVEGVRLLEQHSDVQVVQRRDTAGIERGIVKCFDAWNNSSRRNGVPDHVKRFERRELTRRLVDVLDQVV